MERKCEEEIEDNIYDKVKPKLRTRTRTVRVYRVKVRIFPKHDVHG